jgi:hypothetical protein
MTKTEIKKNIQKLRKSIITRHIPKSQLHYQFYELQQFVTTTDSTENDGGDYARNRLFRLMEEMMVRTDLPD